MSVVMDRAYAEQTGEAYVPGECENFGIHEQGGMKPVRDALGVKWVDHCHAYRDVMEGE